MKGLFSSNYTHKQKIEADGSRIKPNKTRPKVYRFGLRDIKKKKRKKRKKEKKEIKKKKEKKRNKERGKKKREKKEKRKE